MYIFHYDKPNNRWMIFFLNGRHEEYICSFNTLAEAQQFCEEITGETMNVQDHFVEKVLPLFDALMNILTLGLWSVIRGGQRPALKVKKS